MAPCFAELSQHVHMCMSVLTVSFLQSLYTLASKHDKSKESELYIIFELVCRAVHDASAAKCKTCESSRDMDTHSRAAVDSMHTADRLNQATESSLAANAWQREYFSILPELDDLAR